MTAIGLEQMVGAFEEVGSETLRLVRHLDEGQAELPTDCPGWTVRDQLAHMVGLEQVLAGAPEPTGEFGNPAHVVTDIHRYMETHVEVRRRLPLVAVADEFEAMLPRRARQFRDLIAHGDPEVLAPMGNKRPLSASLPIRVFDLWVHEQDIRRAVGQSNRLTGISGRISAERILRAWSKVLPERVEGIDAVVRVVIDGYPDVDQATITLGEGGDETTLSGDVGVLGQLGCGRGSPTAVLGAATVVGDATVIDRLLPHLSFTP